MITIPIEPYWAKIQEHYKTQVNPEGDTDALFEWLKREYGAYGVYITSTPSRDGIEKGMGLLFGEESEATLFALKWA